MTDHFEVNRRNWDERAVIHARDTTGDYMLARFRAGEDALHRLWEADRDLPTTAEVDAPGIWLARIELPGDTT